LCVSTLYSGPRRRTGQGRGREGAGIYPELSLLGFSEGVSPALGSEVARQAALLPSFELTRRELARRGVHLDIKAVHRISLRAGFEILSARKRDLLAWRQGLLPKGTELAGKRVAVASDGGRLRLREGSRRQIGKGPRKSRRRSWKAEWREPKQFVIFELDKQGRMKRGSRPFIDGTLQGPDALMELLAMRLHQLGAAQAHEVVFLGDGGNWIWNRLDEIVRRAGIPQDRIDKALDFCHAVQHVHLALNALSFKDEARDRVFRRQRKQLYRGRVDLLLEELKDYATDLAIKESIWREIAYFEKHAPHMDYRRLREQGKPMGSGAIESVIRRVLNQRLKGNGIQWIRANAEAMLVLRGTALADRWEETFEHVRATMATDRSIDWKWLSPDMRKVPEPDLPDEVSNVISFASARIKRRGA
jgi:hypothetical protein